MTSADQLIDMYKPSSRGAKTDRALVKAVIAQLRPNEEVRHICGWTDQRKKWGEAMDAVITSERILWCRSRTKPNWVSMALTNVVSAHEVARKEWFVFPFKDLVVTAKDGTVFQWVEMHDKLRPCLTAIDAARRDAARH